ncbi:hypothetical protein ARHIZOSPH14_09350 [Agromyces rhizosphaerae]|uniref:Haemophore haem-binding domain-containing protein n=1 Tax=Agromyces rhizosphaerae TaxID=88374 RepID=A0A9W6CZF7_9MICO|nr:hypothetical protein [Agromyces rhizosphaerae]GLI26693.1 hypothetical protein ARHIZOSPH14_09350 [Agromyces rhizosphaerae]
MFKRVIIGAAAAGLLAVGFAAPAHAEGHGGPPDCNWGQLTQYAILDLDFDQGGHSSGEATPRAGLANVFPDLQGRAKLQATCELIESLLPPAP